MSTEKHQGHVHVVRSSPPRTKHQHGVCTLNRRRSLPFGACLIISCAMSAVARTSADAILAFIGSRGADLTRIRTIDAHHAGTGLAAAVCAKAGDVLLRIPRQVWEPLSALDARNAVPEATTQRVDKLAASLGGDATLADATLLAARLARPDMALQAALQPYLTQLPTPDVPLMWPPQLRMALLRGTSASSMAESQVALSASLHASLEDGLEPAAFRRAQALLLSRAHSGDGKPFALVPGLDLLNHGGDSAGAEVRFAKDDAAFEVVLTREHARGEEILIDYGTRASHRLLRLYGFLPAANTAALADAKAAAPPGGTVAVGAGEEALVALLPSAAEMAEAPEDVRMELDAARAALDSLGVRGRSLRLVASSDQRVELPMLANRDAPGLATARRVMRAAVETQQLRQREGSAACEAVSRLGGDGAADVAARERAKLCARLHAREAAVLEAALAEIQADNSQ